MTETKRPRYRYYRAIRNLLLIGGFALLAIGRGVESNIVMLLGGIILLHGFIALVILLVRDSRSSATSKDKPVAPYKIVSKLHSSLLSACR